MKKCSKCGRPLNEKENNLCPACKSNKSVTKKRLVEIMGGAAMFAAALMIKAFTGGRGGKI